MTAIKMPESQRQQWHLRGGHYLGEISALCFLHLPPHLSSLPFLLAGTGSQILVYDLVSANVIKSFRVFEGIRVHGISLENFSKHLNSNTSVASYNYQVAVFGEKRVKLFNLCVEATNFTADNFELTLIHALPRFYHWVLDVSFLKDGVPNSSTEGNTCLAIGCTDNSVHFWDISSSSIIVKVQSPDRCLLYTMRMWGDKFEQLQIASGTIYNEIVIWRVSCLYNTLDSENNKQASLVQVPQYEAVQMCTLIGHEGSIFRISWCTNGLKLASVSDDRSARIWTLHTETDGPNDHVVNVVNYESTILFGHSARVWDCCIFDSLIITAGEDCTCRVWGLDGKELKIIREHIGRGLWRCLYDENSSLLITAGFDSAIKVHQLPISLSSSEGPTVSIEDPFDRNELFNMQIPNSSEKGFMDSKSEYVRCVLFSSEDSIYVATNNGFLYHARLLPSGDVKWSELIRVNEEAPIICMDLLSNSSDPSFGIEDWVAFGDGKGNMMIVQVVGDISSLEIKLTYSWSAELERQLLGTYWCKSLGFRFVFTADPRGSLKLWRLDNILESVSLNSPCLVAEFVSCFGMRIMCLDASFKEEVLVCGDIRGNLLVFPLLKGLELNASDAKTSQLNYFKGAHGISSVSSVSISKSSFNKLEIHSTGADGCICYLEFDKTSNNLEFIGMKQVKELSTIRCISGNYAIGFSSSDFIIWNLISETKLVQIACGGWRRPHSYHLGDTPETKNCFAFVKDEIIYIERKWVEKKERNVYPQNLHLQFHGREIHSLCFIAQEDANDSESCWVATGCEDGTVRLTSYEPGIENWLSSELLGEHVGGSAVRSIYFVSKMHMFVLDSTRITNTKDLDLDVDVEHSYLLISVGAKRVLTCWKQKLSNIESDSNHGSSMSFQWLSSDMPSKSSNNDKKQMINHVVDDDWRYMAVTAFLVKVPHSSISVCFIVVACSDATLTLRALILPYRLWFDVALLGPLLSPILALQHIIIPKGESFRNRSLYVVISGTTDGSISFWDVSEAVENFMERVYSLPIEKFIDCQKRPRTGRGSQGGRRRHSLGAHLLKKKPINDEESGENSMYKVSETEEKVDDFSLDICEIEALHILKNVHQSGVNCVHVSCVEGTDTYCVVSGGDDQALNCLIFDLSPKPLPHGSPMEQCRIDNEWMRFIAIERCVSAHSSAVKGVWTDGNWVFSTGLDQRLRCWNFDEHAKLIEYSHIIVSVPEPESLDAKICTRNHYQIAVAGRGLQMLDFLISDTL